MKLTPEDIRHVAHLARLELGPDDLERYVRELGAILGYMGKLSELDTRGLPPTASVGVVRLPRRPDEVRPGWSTEELLSNAPEVHAGHFRVPRVVE